MSYSCCSQRSFSSYSLGRSLLYPSSFGGSSFPSSLISNMGLCSPGTYQLGSSLHRGCQVTCCEPSSCQKSHAVSRSCQTSCYQPRTSTFCTPLQMTNPGSPGFGSSSSCSIGYGSRSCYSQGCGSSSFKPLSYGGHGFSSLSCGSRSSHPNYLVSRMYQSSCFRPACASGFY
ncbi:keratin-associated protein 13-1-like [Rhynchocyon petersi]